MASIKARDTSPELAVRRILHRSGFRFRLHSKHLPGRPDIVLPRYRAAIFVNGCFWHGHENCAAFRIPKTRTDFWQTKIAANTARDRRVAASLGELGWRCLTVWECAVRGKGRLADEELGKALSANLKSDDFWISEIRGERFFGENEAHPNSNLSWIMPGKCST